MKAFESFLQAVIRNAPDLEFSDLHWKIGTAARECVFKDAVVISEWRKDSTSDGALARSDGFKIAGVVSIRDDSRGINCVRLFRGETLVDAFSVS